MKATEIKPEKLTVGMKITILRWLSHRDNSYCGDILEVKAIALPYIAVHRHGGRMQCDRFELDTRRVSIAALSDEFVCAILGDESNEWPEEVG